MNGDYGIRVGTAIKAVARLHSDTSRLLRDCDGAIGEGRPSIFKNYATKDLTYHVKADYWMAVGVYRFYDASDILPGLVEGLTICFAGKEDFLEQPLLLLGRIEYLNDPDGDDGCDGWDLWYTYFNTSPSLAFGTVYDAEPHDPDRIKGINLVSVPLFSVNSMDDVIALMNRVRSPQV